MEGMEEGMVGTYRPATEVTSLPDPPPYPGKAVDELEVKIAPSKDEIFRNGETAKNGSAPADADDRWG